MLSPGTGGETNFYAQQPSFSETGIMNVFQVADPDVDAVFTRLAAAPPKSSAQASKDLTDVIVRKALALPISGTDTIAMCNSKLRGVKFPEGGAQLTSNTLGTTG
ncbi:hypothetical protein [Streptomyces caniscabiei]|uniref:hypothetical protein n=1 Tax=Streptomyces caniscabiei TaxID=2746961 RepID=UPI0029B43D71|nr:hypothetical protein [Streptomyces caniscabiei]MDX3726187.1 hypothetical protein [Streptomyces caniscabiei]